jgi:hypothetical protein
MTPDDRRHGTYAGAVAGCRDACCKQALSYYRKRLLHDLANGNRRLIDNTGYRRRLQALQALGWTLQAIADRMGEPSTSHICYAANRSRKVTRKRDQAMRAVYEELSMTLGPSDRARAHAERQGWPPPLAWDDDTIDDPAAIPSTGNKERYDQAELLVELEHLIGTDHPHRIAYRLDYRSPDNLARRLYRAGRADLAQRFQRADA